MKRFFFYFTSALIISLHPSCKGPKMASTSGGESPTLFHVGDTPVSTEEFVYVYKKNNINNDSAYQRTDVNEYLDLFTNFKLKVKEAEALGMDTTQSFLNEFNTYKGQLSKPYLTEGSLMDKFTQEAYDRYQEQLKAAHILIRLEKDALGEDTLKAYGKIMDIRKKYLGGEDFGELALQFSEDPSAKRNKGNLGYFTSMQMVYPFEDAAYKTPVGEVSQPVRTRFGYHLIKVEDKRPNQGKREAAHIMIRATQGMTKEDSIKARRKIFEIHKQLTEGGNWNNLVSQFSEDLNSKDRGGKIKPFSTGDGLPPAFEEAAFSLKEEGQMSAPFSTPYGWHIVKLEKKIGLEPFEKMEPIIKSAIERDTRAQMNRQAMIARLKKENGFVSNEAVKEFALSSADSSLTRASWSYKGDSSRLNETLFTIGGQVTRLQEFTDYARKAQSIGVSFNPDFYMRKLYDDFEEKQLVDYEEQNLSEKYIDYRMLVKEYREGILLFKLMDQKVWSKAARDTLGLKNYFNAHHGEYMWGERIDATVYATASEEVLDSVKTILATGDSTQTSRWELDRRFNEAQVLTLDIKEGLFEKKDLAILEKVSSEPGQYTLKDNGHFHLVIIKGVVPPAPKKLKEIKGEVISDYQSELEKDWIKELKDKYPVKIDEKELEKVLDEFDKAKP